MHTGLYSQPFLEIPTVIKLSCLKQPGKPLHLSSAQVWATLCDTGGSWWEPEALGDSTIWLTLKLKIPSSVNRFLLKKIFKAAKGPSYWSHLCMLTVCSLHILEAVTCCSSREKVLHCLLLFSEWKLKCLSHLALGGKPLLCSPIVGNMWPSVM